MPPASRNHLVPTTGDTPASMAASSLVRPAAIADQNVCKCSRRPTGGRPGERRAFRVDRSERRFPAIATSFRRVLRRPIETKQYACGDYMAALARHEIQPSMSRAGCPYDNAMAESFMKTLKQEEVDGRTYRDLADATEAIGSSHGNARSV